MRGGEQLLIVTDADGLQDEWCHVGTLKRLALVVDSPLEGVTMHALTQAVIRDLLMGGSGTSALGQMLDMLDTKIAAFNSDKPETYAVGRRYAQHAMSVASHAPRWQEALSEPILLALARLCHNTASFCEHVESLFSKALELHKQSLAIRLKVHGPDHPYVVKSKDMITRLTVMITTSLRKK